MNDAHLIYLWVPSPTTPGQAGLSESIDDLVEFEVAPELCEIMSESTFSEMYARFLALHAREPSVTLLAAYVDTKTIVERAFATAPSVSLTVRAHVLCRFDVHVGYDWAVTKVLREAHLSPQTCDLFTRQFESSIAAAAPPRLSHHFDGALAAKFESAFLDVSPAMIADYTGSLERARMTVSLTHPWGTLASRVRRDDLEGRSLRAAILLALLE